MERRIDHYLERLVSPDSMTFYKAVCEFAEEKIEPNYLTWERNHELIPEDIIEEMGQMGPFLLRGIGQRVKKVRFKKETQKSRCKSTRWCWIPYEM